MSKYKLGYARVSTLQQDEALQHGALTTAGCDRIFVDKASGKLESRPALDDLLKQARPGETVAVGRLDRLGRSLRHLLETVAALEQRGVSFVSLTENIDTPPLAANLRCTHRVVFNGCGSASYVEAVLQRERYRPLLRVRRVGAVVRDQSRAQHRSVLTGQVQGAAALPRVVVVAVAVGAGAALPVEHHLGRSPGVHENSRTRGLHGRSSADQLRGPASLSVRGDVGGAHEYHVPVLVLVAAVELDRPACTSIVRLPVTALGEELAKSARGTLSRKARAPPTAATTRTAAAAAASTDLACCGARPAGSGSALVRCR